MQAGSELFDHSRLPCALIVLFTDVVTQVIEFTVIILEKLDELPVTKPDAGARGATLITVMRIMPKKRMALLCLTLQGW